MQREVRSRAREEWRWTIGGALVLAVALIFPWRWRAATVAARSAAQRS